jgi:hypothetical protein
MAQPAADPRLALYESYQRASSHQHAEIVREAQGDEHCAPSHPPLRGSAARAINHLRVRTGHEQQGAERVSVVLEVNTEHDERQAQADE